MLITCHPAASVPIDLANDVVMIPSVELKVPYPMRMHAVCNDILRRLMAFNRLKGIGIHRQWPFITDGCKRASLKPLYRQTHHK